MLLSKKLSSGRTSPSTGGMGECREEAQPARAKAQKKKNLRKRRKRMASLVWIKPPRKAEEKGLVRKRIARGQTRAGGARRR